MLLDPVPQGVLAAARTLHPQPPVAAPGGLQGETDGPGEVREGVPVARIELAEFPGGVGVARFREGRRHRLAVLDEPGALVVGEDGVERFGHPGADEGVGLAVVVGEDHRPDFAVEPDQRPVLGLGAPDRIPVQVHLVVVVVGGEGPQGGVVLGGVRGRGRRRARGPSP